MFAGQVGCPLAPLLRGVFLELLSTKGKELDF